MPDKFSQLLQQNAIGCIAFTSPSTVRGFLKNVVQSDLSKVLSLPVISIGPVTTSEAKKLGFTQIYTAHLHTTDGMIALLNKTF
jgi:uroporphyrinogen-III synthase